MGFTDRVVGRRAAWRRGVLTADPPLSSLSHVLSCVCRRFEAANSDARPAASLSHPAKHPFHSSDNVREWRAAPNGQMGLVRSFCFPSLPLSHSASPLSPPFGTAISDAMEGGREEGGDGRQTLLHFPRNCLCFKLFSVLLGLVNPNNVTNN